VEKSIIHAICCLRFVASNKLLISATSCLQQIAVYIFGHRVATALGGKQQRVMCVRACAISVRLPSPRALTGDIYINSSNALSHDGMSIGCFPCSC